MVAIWRSVRGAFFFSALFALLILINVLQTLSLAILPFSKQAFRVFNRWCAGFWWGACVIGLEKINGARIVVSGDAIPMRENAIVIANHQQMSDILVIMMLAYSKGRIGDLKWFVKDVIKFVPGIGWGMLFLDCLFVKRNWDADETRIKKTFSKFKENKIPMWLVSFVEGTRLTTNKLRRAQEYAAKKNLPVLSRVLLPRTKGFAATKYGLQGHAKAVYDLTIGYPDGVPTLWEVISGSSREFHVHVARYELESLPSGSEALSSWLVQKYVEKDGLLGNFLKNRSFATK